LSCLYAEHTHKKICLCLWKWKKQLNLYCLNSHVVIWLKILISDHANFEENNTKKFKVSTLNLMEKFGKVHKKSTIINQPENWFRSHNSVVKNFCGSFEPYMTYNENSYRYRLNNFEFFAFSALCSCPPKTYKFWNWKSLLPISEMKKRMSKLKCYKIKLQTLFFLKKKEKW